jgi:hypothetical protein
VLTAGERRTLSLAEDVPALAVARWMVTGPKGDRQSVESATIVISIDSAALDDTINLQWREYPTRTNHAAGERLTSDPPHVPAWPPVEVPVALTMVWKAPGEIQYLGAGPGSRHRRPADRIAHGHGGRYAMSGR